MYLGTVLDDGVRGGADHREVAGERSGYGERRPQDGVPGEHLALEHDRGDVADEIGENNGEGGQRPDAGVVHAEGIGYPADDAAAVDAGDEEEQPDEIQEDVPVDPFDDLLHLGLPARDGDEEGGRPGGDGYGPDPHAYRVGEGEQDRRRGQDDKQDLHARAVDVSGAEIMPGEGEVVAGQVLRGQARDDEDGRDQAGGRDGDADDGVLEATVPGNSSALYSGDVYNQPDGAFSVVTDENGNEWYQIQSADIESGIASVPSEKDAYSFSDMPDDTAFSYAGNGVVEASSEDGGSSLLYSGEFYNEPDAPHSVVTDDAGNTWYQMSADDIADGVQAPSFNGNAFGFSDMPDDTSYSFGGNGIIEASSADGDSVLYNSACFAEPEGSYQTVTDADGNSWYQMSAEAIGDGSISAPSFIGNESESYNPTFGDLSPSSENVSFPGMAEETVLTSAGNGVVMANEASDSNTLWYNSAIYDEPEAPHSTIQSSNGVSWYAMEPHASAPEFESGENAAAYNQAQFREFMPGYGQQITSVDGSKAAEGQFEVRHSDGGGTKFYDVTQYAAPKGDYQVFEDANGKQWYSIKGEPAVERKPVYENGKPVYEKDGKNVKTVSVDSVRYKTTPARFGKPGKRKSEIKAPKRKK